MVKASWKITLSFACDIPFSRLVLSQANVRWIKAGMFEIPAGGRRCRALERLVKQKPLAKNAPIACTIREDGFAEKDCPAENIQPAPLPPCDQLRAFLVFRQEGVSEEVAATDQFVWVAVVRPRLRLASRSPRLLGVLAADGVPVDPPMAGTVSRGSPACLRRLS